MTGAVLTKAYGAPPIDRHEILRYMGAKGADEALTTLLDECILEAESATSYKVCYAEFPVKDLGECLDLGFCKTASKSLFRTLRGCKSVILFAATLGLSADRLIMRYSSLNPSRALIFDAIFTERIEALCDAFCYEMKEKYSKENKEVLSRFSAGYGDLSLEVQREIFLALSPEKRIGLSLNETLLMIPTKSVTALMGVKDFASCEK